MPDSVLPDGHNMNCARTSRLRHRSIVAAIRSALLASGSAMMLGMPVAAAAQLDYRLVDDGIELAEQDHDAEGGWLTLDDHDGSDAQRVYIEPGAAVSLSNLVQTDWLDNSVNYDGWHVDENEIDGHGGVFIVDSDSTLQLQSVTLYDNRVEGGFEELEGATTGQEDWGDGGNAFGGAIFVRQGGSLDIEGAAITGSVAEGRGGVGGVDQRSGTGYGGAVYVDTDAVVVIRGGEFSNNRALGGVPVDEEGNGTGTPGGGSPGDPQFDGGDGFGGAFFVRQGGSLTLIDVEVTGNSAESGNRGGDGSGNEWARGGGIYADRDSDVTLIGGEVSGNQLVPSNPDIDYVNGSALYLDSVARLHLQAEANDQLLISGTVAGSGAELTVGDPDGILTGTVVVEEKVASWSLSGELDLHPGTLLLKIDAEFDADLNVHRGGILSGHTHFRGQVRVDDGGTISPGDGDAATWPMHTLKLAPEAVVKMGLADPDVAGGGVNDRFGVSAELELGGLLNVTDLGGFEAGTYTLMSYSGELTDNGMTVNRLPEGFNPEAWTVEVDTTEQLVLLVPGPLLETDQVQLDFEAAVVGNGGSSLPLAVTNTGDVDLTVGSLALGGDHVGDFHVALDNCSGAVLAPRAQCLVEIEFDPVTTGQRSAYLDIPSDSPTSSDQVALTGTGVQAQINIAPMNVNFDEVGVGTLGGPVPVTIRNTGSAELALGNLSIGGSEAADFSQVDDTCSNATVPVDESCTVGVSFTPSETGLRSAELDIPSNAPDGPHVVGLAGTGVEIGIAVMPESLSFGPHAVGESGSASVELINVGEVDITVHSLSAPEPPFTISGGSCGNPEFAIQPLESCSIEVAFEPDSRGEYVGAMQIESDAPDSPHTVTLTGTGVSAIPVPLMTRWPAILLILGSLCLGLRSLRRTEGKD